MTESPTDVVLTRTVRIPAGTLSINLLPAFGGGYVIRFTGTGGGFIGSEEYAPASVTFSPDGTLTYPLPYGAPTA